MTRRSHLLRCTAPLVLLLGFGGHAWAAASLDEIAKQIQALQNDNARMRAENRAMKAVIASMKGEKGAGDVRRQRTADSHSASPTKVADSESAATVTADKKLRFGPITLSPGGFLAAEGVYRSRTEQADISSSWQAIPFQAQGATDEFRLTARQTRLALLAEAAVTPSYLASGYVEMDFLGAGASANSNESNSYNPRIRHLYAALDNSNYGMHLLAGQTFSLLTLNSKGITPRNEVTPPTIDGQYVPGFDWKRQAQVRLTKDFNKRLWLSVAAEEAQTTFGSPTCVASANGATAVGTVGGVNGITCALPGTGNLNPNQNYTLNHAPDVTAKIALEAPIAGRDVHLEAVGLFRDLYDRASYVSGTSANLHSAGYGVGGGLIAPLLPGRLDLQVSGLWGRGIGSYGTAQMPDSTFNSNGSLKPLQEGMALAGFIAHATPTTDVYAFAGFESVGRGYFANGAMMSSGSSVAAQYSATGAGYTGYGVPNANNNGCGLASAATSNNFAITSASCSGNTKTIYQATAGFWNKLYKGAFGEVRAGVQYSYTRRELFQTTFNTITAALGANEHTVLTSFRYYPFQ